MGALFAVTFPFSLWLGYIDAPITYGLILVPLVIYLLLNREVRFYILGIVILTVVYLAILKRCYVLAYSRGSFCRFPRPLLLVSEVDFVVSVRAYPGDNSGSLAVLATKPVLPTVVRFICVKASDSLKAIRYNSSNAQRLSVQARFQAHFRAAA